MSATTTTVSGVVAPAQPWLFGAAFAVFAALAGTVGWRLHQLQIVDAEMLATMGERQVNRTWTLQAPRGTIKDADGAPIVESVGSWMVSCDPRYMEDKLLATVELSRILKVPREELRKEFESGRNGRILAKDLTEAVAAQIRNLKLVGVKVLRGYTRTYRDGVLAAHVTGFVKADGVGAAGLEQQFDKILKGTDGKETLRVDAQNRPVIDGQETIPAKPGCDVQLTLNRFIQRTLEEQLDAAVKKHAPAHAAGVVIRPQTGEIVAMASWPTYNPMTREGYSEEASRNNVVAFNYEPGSTMKPLIVGASVADKLTRFTESINGEHGRWTYTEGRAKRTIHEKTGGHGILTVTQGIALSDNILMAKLGVRFEPDRMWQWIDILGFGKKTGICLPGEQVGIVSPRKGWKRINEGMSVAIGHNISVTPLQLAMAHAAVANGGVWNPPRLIKRITQEGVEGRILDLPTPTLVEPRRMFAAADASALQEAMTHTMTEGTGEKAELKGYTSAGKTGTAEKLVEGRYANDHNVCSFVCWAPAQPDRIPELLALVIIDDPSILSAGRTGASTAAPVVQQVLQAGLEYLGVPKTSPTEDTVVAGDEKPSPVKRRAR